MGDLERKVCLVTGAGRGLGQACAELIAREGGSVVVADIDENGGRSAWSA